MAHATWRWWWAWRRRAWSGSLLAVCRRGARWYCSDYSARVGDVVCFVRVAVVLWVRYLALDILGRPPIGRRELRVEEVPRRMN